MGLSVRFSRHVIYLEGPLATGKSTVAVHIAGRFDGSCIEEVNKLFSRPADEARTWYYERQVDRMGQARTAESDGHLAVLAGDPYQPIWFNWIFPSGRFEPWYRVLKFFEENSYDCILPNFYGFTMVDEEERIRRELEREIRMGRTRAEALAKHARYVPMHAPLEAYFLAVGAEFPGFVLTLDTGNFETAMQKLMGYRPPPKPKKKEFLEFASDWLSSHSPGDYQ